MDRHGAVFIPVEVLLNAYRSGRFPMCHDDGEIYWHDPDPRAVFPLRQLVPNARLRRTIRSARFRITVNAAFEAVLEACADRPNTWIDRRIKASYVALHHAGHAHSVETWEGEDLVGGLYGVAVGGAFCGESMFSRVPNAGKVAFHALVDMLVANGFTLFDTQYVNDFTIQLGAEEVSRAVYRRSLAAALQLQAQFPSTS